MSEYKRAAYDTAWQTLTGGERIMELPEYDTWIRVELFGDRGRWFAAPSPVDPNLSADFDTEEDALSYARSRYPGQEWSQHRAPVRGQWRTRRMSGQA